MGHAVPHAIADRARRPRPKGIPRAEELDVSRDRERSEVQSGRENLIWLVIAFLAILGFAALTVAIKARVVFPFDQPLLAITHGWNVDPLVWKVLTETANIPLFLIGGGFGIWLWFNKRRRESLVVLLLFAAVCVTRDRVT